VSSNLRSGAAKELETPTDRLDRVRRLILRVMDIRDTLPLFTSETTANKAEKNLGRCYGQCVALEHDLDELSETVLADRLFDNLVAACDAE
jgi:hypothetical protein